MKKQYLLLLLVAGFCLAAYLLAILYTDVRPARALVLPALLIGLCLYGLLRKKK